MPEEKIVPNLDTPIEWSTQDIIDATGMEAVASKEDFTKWVADNKGVETKEVIKEIPYSWKDDYIKGVVDYYDKHGNVSDYVKNNVDYEGIEDAAIIRLEMKNKNEGLSERAIDHLTAQELQKYKLKDDASDDDKSLQKELLGVRTKRIREEFTKEQEKFKTPETPSVNMEAWEKTVSENDSTKGVLADKKLGFKFGEKDFNLDVENPQQLVDMTVDNTAFFKLFVNEDKTTNFDKWFKVMAYAQNPEAFEKSLITHGKSVGAESAVEGLSNAELEQLKRSGGDGDLLTAFAEHGVHK